MHRAMLLTRRAVLGGALATGASIAAVRLLGVPGLETLLQPATASSGWGSPLQQESARVAQLLRRTTFGYSPADLEQALSDGYERTLERLLDSTPQAPPLLPAAESASRFSPLRLPQLQLWWANHILNTRTPFAERMTLFWHGHFTSDYQKVGLRTPWLYWQNLAWRSMAFSDLRSMLLRVTVDPAMLRYLDLATSSGAAPNENYSRELMELFTMGADTYTEDDVRAGAKALAGWREPRPGEGRSGIFVPRRAYDGAVTFLGRTGTFDLEGVVDRILAQPATAEFIARKVAWEFVSPAPDEAYVKRLASGFRSSRYQVKHLLRDVLTSPEFVAEDGYRSLVKAPVEYMAHTLKALGARQQAKLMVALGPGLGQALFDPPDVNGWPRNEAWINSNTLIARVNFVTVALKLAPAPPARDAPATQLDGVMGRQTSWALTRASDDRSRWFAVLASPEFQLK
jgi:uncharacterized protein (DUF1800 family)